MTCDTPGDGSCASTATGALTRLLRVRVRVRVRVRARVRVRLRLRVRVRGRVSGCSPPGAQVNYTVST